MIKIREAKVKSEGEIICPYCDYRFKPRVLKVIKECPICKRYFKVRGIELGKKEVKENGGD